MRVERLLRKMEERAKRRQKRKEEVIYEIIMFDVNNLVKFISVGNIVSKEET